MSKDSKDSKNSTGTGTKEKEKDKDKKSGKVEDWTAGFRVGAKKGMTCDTCRCLVRENPGDARAHRLWHESLDRS
jgi:hypothetical protein